MTKYNFPRGFYSSPQTIFEKLREIGIQVDKQLQHYLWLIVYDMEVLLLECKKADQSIWKTEHTPVSVCINSNVPGFNDVHFIFEPKLVEQMIHYMYLISDQAYELCKSRWKFVFDQLERKWNSNEDREQENSVRTDNVTDTCTESNFVEPPSKELICAVQKEKYNK